MMKGICLVAFLASAWSLNALQNEKGNMEVSVENKKALLSTVLQGRLDMFRSCAVDSPLPHAEFQQRDRHIIYAWGMDYVCSNGIIEKDISRIPTDEEIDWAIEHFSANKLPFMWWTSAKVLEARGFQFGGVLTGIVLDISRGIPSKPATSEALKIEIVRSENDLRSFATLAAEAFAMNSSVAEQWLDLNASVSERGEQIHFMAYLDGVPAGTATLTVSPSSSGIWNLATSSEHRKQGIGAALVHAALAEAKKRQYSRVMAILMPKGMAWGLFTKLGFKEVTEFPFYIYGVSAEELEK